MRLAVMRLKNLPALRAGTHYRASTYKESIVALIERTHKNAGLAEAKLHWSILVPECVELD